MQCKQPSDKSTHFMDHKLAWIQHHSMVSIVLICSRFTHKHRHAFFIPFFALTLILFNSMQFAEVSVNYFSYKFQRINQHQQHKYIYLNEKDKQTMDKSSWKTHLYTSSGNATVQCLENKSHFIFGVVL